VQSSYESEEEESQSDHDSSLDKFVKEGDMIMDKAKIVRLPLPEKPANPKIPKEFLHEARSETDFTFENNPFAQIESSLDNYSFKRLVSGDPD